MKVDELLETVIRCAVNLTLSLEADDRDPAEYIDLIPQFLLSGYDTDGEDDDYLLTKFLAYVTLQHL